MIQLTDEELINELKKRFEENNKNIQELHRLNKILTKVNNKLSEAEAMKSHFISNISNEIINPFTSILALSKALLEVNKEDWQKAMSMISLIHTEAFNLDFQFKNIFTAAKIEAGEIYPEISNVDIEALIKEISNSFIYEAIKKEMVIDNNINYPEKDKTLFFKTDPEKLRLILTNLVSNAIKFSNKNSNVDIACDIKNKNLILTVKDYGLGIAKQHQETIFDRFKKLDTEINSINKGHGLGLAIVKALIDLLNGSIKIESKKKEGAKFTITIPESEEESEDFTIDGYELLFKEDKF